MKMWNICIFTISFPNVSLYFSFVFFFLQPFLGFSRVLLSKPKCWHCSNQMENWNFIGFHEFSIEIISWQSRISMSWSHIMYVCMYVSTYVLRRFCQTSSLWYFGLWIPSRIPDSWWWHFYESFRSWDHIPI